MQIQASFEDYTYVIIGIIWMIYSVYKGKKKKDAQQSKSSKPKAPSFLDSLFEEVVGIKETASPAYAEPELKTEPKTESIISDNVMESDTLRIYEKEKVFSYDDVYEDDNFAKTKRVVEKEAMLQSFETQSNNSYLQKKNIKVKRINLRQAVIYSEILKRKYF